MRFRHLIAATAFGAIVLAACGSGSPNSSPYSSSSAPPKPVSPPAIAAPGVAVVRAGDTSLGPVLVDANGLTLYGLTQDTNGTTTCVGACAKAWPPLIVHGTSLPAGLDAKVFSVASRPDGSHQLKAGKWPLYRFAGDAVAGDTNGQGSAGVWFAVTPTGTLHKS
jgi:predicted lipoprotein with Yx(FWY)xxD motif